MFIMYNISDFQFTSCTKFV